MFALAIREGTSIDHRLVDNQYSSSKHISFATIEGTDIDHRLVVDRHSDFIVHKIISMSSSSQITVGQAERCFALRLSCRPHKPQARCISSYSVGGFFSLLCFWHQSLTYRDSRPDVSSYTKNYLRPGSPRFIKTLHYTLLYRTSSRIVLLLLCLYSYQYNSGDQQYGTTYMSRTKARGRRIHGLIAALLPINMMEQKGE
jgi:hypothetical protein